MSTTTILRETLPELLAPPRATEPTETGLGTLLALWPVFILPPGDRLRQRGVRFEVHVHLTMYAPAGAHVEGVAAVRRALEDAGYDIGHIDDRLGLPAIAVYRPGTA